MRAWVVLASIASVVLVICNETAAASIGGLGIGLHFEHNSAGTAEDIFVLDYSGHVEDDLAIFQKADVLSRHGNGKCDWHRMNAAAGDVHLRPVAVSVWEENLLKACAWPNVSAVDDIQPNSWRLASIFDGDIEFRDSVNSNVSNRAVKYSNIRPNLLLADFLGDGDSVPGGFRSISSSGSGFPRGGQSKEYQSSSDRHYDDENDRRYRNDERPASHYPLGAKVLFSLMILFGLFFYCKWALIDVPDDDINEPGDTAAGFGLYVVTVGLVIVVYSFLAVIVIVAP